MADAPVVRDLNQVVATIGQGVAGQKAQIDQMIADNQTYGDAQVAGLDAKKVKAFEGIEQAANNKNMFFSGFSPDEQAKYTSDTYLPALAALQQTIAQTRNNLMMQKNELDTNVFNKAWDSVEQDRAVLADWNKMTAQQQFEASESEKQRVFQAQQNEADRQLTRSEGAADRATQIQSANIGASSRGGSGGSGSKEASNQELFAAALAESAGTDGKVSPGAYNALKKQWVSAGYGDYKSFHDKYWTFANDKHWWDYK